MVSLIKGNGPQPAGRGLTAAAGRGIGRVGNRTAGGAPGRAGAALQCRRGGGAHPQGAGVPGGAARAPTGPGEAVSARIPHLLRAGRGRGAGGLDAGAGPTEMGQTCLVLGVGFGVVYGAYAFFWMTETLPRYYDENRIAQFAQGAMHIHIPGVYYNNRNWRYVLRAFRAWSMASMLLLPPSLAVAGQLDPHLGGKATVAAFAVYILSLFGCIVVPAKRHEKDEE